MKINEIKKIDESPIALHNASELVMMTKRLLDDFIDESPTEAELSKFLNIMGKEIKNDGVRTMIVDIEKGVLD